MTLKSYRIVVPPVAKATFVPQLIRPHEADNCGFFSTCNILSEHLNSVNLQEGIEKDFKIHMAMRQERLLTTMEIALVKEIGSMEPSGGAAKSALVLEMGVQFLTVAILSAIAG